MHYFCLEKAMRLRLLLVMMAICVMTAVAAEPFTVVLDPGHGGKDYGCVGKITNEKTIVLDVARRVGELIEKELPEVGIVYTRKDDRFIELSERARIANRADADLFISIHVNSVDKRAKGRTTIAGASVYTLGLHRSDDNLAVAMRENSVIELESDFTETYQGFDPNSSESYIIFELTQNQHMQQSIEFADVVQRELVGTAGRLDKNVRQAGFLVLRATSMPSVLVELDFICNPKSEKFLDSKDGKEKCARSIFNAFKAYYSKHCGDVTTKGTKINGREAKDDVADGFAHDGDAGTESKITYHIQFLTSSRKLSDKDKRLNKVPDVNYYVDGRTYKYISGCYDSLAKAKKALGKLRKKHPQSFIIKMRDGQRVK